jgi:hypothetical protein
MRENPYKGAGFYVLKIRGGFGKKVQLQVTIDRAKEFEQILISQGVNRESVGYMYVTGVNKWFILLFVLPFGLMILWMML